MGPLHHGLRSISIINAVAFLLVPDCHRRVGGGGFPQGWASLGAALWIGGTVVAVATPLAPLPLDALLVQPHCALEFPSTAAIVVRNGFGSPIAIRPKR